MNETQYLAEKEIELKEQFEAQFEAHFNQIEAEYLERLEVQQLYQPNHQTVLKTEKMPTTPIAPKTLVQGVTKVLTSKDVTISNDTPSLIEEICKVFNFCIESNTKGFHKSLVYSAQTGSGKSVSLQTYVSLLKKESSLIVVSKVDEAIKYCKFINELSNDTDYARCYYQINDKNKDSVFRVENYRLKDYRCIVISHSMLVRLNQKENVDLYRLYNEKQRDLIVIDEKVSFYQKYEFSNKDMNELFELLTRISTDSKIIEEITKNSDFDLKQKIFDLQTRLEDYTSTFESKEKPITLIEKKAVKDFFNDELIEAINYIVQIRIDELLEELKLIGNLSNKHYETSIGTKINDLLESIKNVFKDDFFYYKSNYKDAFVRVKNILNKLGASVVLDATASINEFYKVANRYAGSIRYIDAKQIRKYSNLTIHKAKGFPQSRSKIYRGLAREDIKANAKMYISYANSILKDEDDKLLIITFKDFKSHLMGEIDDKRIQFTHWGDHIGKNDWSDCNKVMIIGWNYLNPLVQISTIMNAINDEIDLAVDLITNDVIKKFEITQLADDLVQGVMRSKARIIASKDSDCNETELYLFYDDTKEQQLEVLDLFESQFPNANIKDWTPKGILPQKKKGKPEQNIDKIISLLQQKEKTHQTYLLQDVINDTGINKTTMNRYLKNPYLEEQLQKNGYICKNLNGKSIHFVLK